MNRLFSFCLIITLVLVLSCSKSSTSAANEVVADPQISPPGGSFDEPVSILIYCPTYDARIHYTTDGTQPTTNSELYTGLFQVNTNTTIKAKAFRDGYISSAVVSESYQFSASAVEPVIIDPPGGAISGPQTVTLYCATPNAQIRYTLDGSDPTITSLLYTEPITISSSLILKARAYVEGQIPSIISIAEFTLTQMPKPIFSPEGGAYTLPQTISISHPYPDVDIRYTRDGSDPNESSEIYSEPFVISSNTVVKAQAFREEGESSDIASAYYFINLSSPMQLVQGGTFFNGTANVQLSDFLISRWEISEMQWDYVMMDMETIVPDNPKNSMNWVDAIEYCNYRSMAEGLEPCYSWGDWGTNPSLWPDNWQIDHLQISCNWDASGYRLPTEMEWMYAAAGGQSSQGYIYSGSDDVDAVAWYSGNTSEPQLVGTKQPNELGIFDMSGNLWELCWDLYSEGYPDMDTQDPSGPDTGLFRVMRGGSFSTSANSCTVAGRFYAAPNLSADSHGFRVVRRP